MKYLKKPAKQSELQQKQLIETVRKILSDVKKNGDKAVAAYSKKFDGIGPKNFEVGRKETEDAYAKVDEQTVIVFKQAASNIKKFAEEQLAQFKDFEYNIAEGVAIGQRIVPLERVGCYVPGGRYPLPSTALMCVIPAKVAKVKEVIVCSPKIRPEVIVAADIAGADRIFKIGGVQAIGAMAYGTKTVPKVDKIVGPGNSFVAAAKKEVYGEVGIDFIAGPSEVLVIADEKANPAYVAADLLAQAEHDPSAKPGLIVTSKEMASRIMEEVKIQLKKLATKEIAGKAMKNGAIILAENSDEAANIANEMAPEHLELQIENPDEIIPKLKNYGSLFIGEYSAEVFGDYCSGTNHTLPTNGAARYAGGLSVKDFVKMLTWQKITKEGSGEMVRIASKLAEVEGLAAHKNAAEIRK